MKRFFILSLTMILAVSAWGEIISEVFDFKGLNAEHTINRGESLGFTVNNGSDRTIYSFTIADVDMNLSRFGGFIGGATNGNFTLKTSGLLLKGRILSILNLRNGDKVKIEYKLASGGSLTLADATLIGNTTDNTFESGTEYTISTTDESVHLDIISSNNNNYITKVTVTPYYNITEPSEVIGGSVTADKTSAAEGETVTITISPDAGHKLKENTLIATYNGSETLSLTNTGDLTYTFTMPGYDVTVSAEFESTSAALTDISTATVNLSATQIPYTGEEQAPTVTSVVLGENTLNAETDYEVLITGQTDIGENYSATVTGKGSYSGTASATWSITRGVGSISFSPESGSVSLGTTNFSVAVTKVGDGSVTYSSGTESVATIDALTGLVTPISAGTTTITATVANGTNYDYATPTATYELTVSPLYTVTLSHKYGPLTVSCVEAGQSSGQAAAGDVITVSTGEPNAGYTESSIKIYKTGDSDKTSVATLSEGTFTMPAEDITIEVGYSRKNLSVTSNVPGGNGSLTFTSSRQDGKFQVDVTTVTITVSPDAGYRLKENTLIATYNGSETLSLTNAGELTYTFTMPGYDVTVSAEFELNTQTATITAESAQSVTYNGTPQAAVATASAGGVVITYYTNSEHTEGETTTAPTNAGTYYAVVSQSDANYTSDPVNVTFTINKATLTATADNKNKTVGEANPELTVTVTGFVNNETAENATGYTAPTASTEATAESPAGEYTITVSGGSADNYDFQYTNGTLSVTAATPVNHTVNGASTENGIALDKESATAGATVTITITIPEGKQIVGGKPIVMSGETPVEVSAVPETTNQFTFTMPDGDVIVSAAFELVNYSITYEGLEGASMDGMNPESYTIETETFTLFNPTKEGSVFAGWTGTGLTEATTTVTITKGSTGVRSYTATFEEIPSGAEEYVSAATTWTFNSQTAGEITSRKVIDKLYARVVSGRSYTFEALATAQTLTFSDGASTQVSVEKVATGTGQISYNTKIATANDSPSGSSNDMTPSFAFNTTVKGTVYAYLQEIGESHNSSYRQRIYFGNGTSTISSVYSQGGAGALGVEEIKYTSSSAGTFVVGSTTALSKIYAIRFVPTRSITISDAIEHGTVTADKSEGGIGDVVTLSVTPSTGYELGSVSVNGTAIEGTTFAMPDANVTVTATFNAVNYAITVTQSTGGEVKVSVAGGEATSSNTTAQYGQTVTLSNMPNGSYTFSSYSVTKTNGGEAVTITDGSFTMPAEAVTITATFAESAKTNISGAVVTLSENSFTYDGNTHAPGVTKVTLNKMDLTLTSDYTVNEITSQTNVGTYTVTVTGTGNYTGEATANWTIKRNLGVTLDGTLQWATYYAAEDLAKPEGVTVYKVTGVSETAVQTEEVNYIKANTGVLLYSGSAVSEDNLKVGPGSGVYYESELLGSTSTGSMTDGTNYVLYNNQFMPAEDNTLLANHCYLQISVASGTRSLTIEHGDGNTTGIHTTRKDHGVMISDKYYTLSGQRIEKPTKKGLYIVNGRKVVIK